MADIDDLKKQIDDINRRVASLGGEFFKDIDQAIASFGGGVKGAEAALKSLNKEMNSLNTDVNYFYETLKKITKELSGQTNFNKDITKSFTKLSSIASQLKYDQNGISELSKKDLISIDKKLQIEKESLEVAISENEKRKGAIVSILKSKSERDKLNESELRALRKEYEQIKETNKEAEAFYTNPEFGIEALIKANTKRLKQEKDIAANLGLVGVAFKGISNTLQKMGIDSEVIKEMSDDLDKAAAKGKVGFKELFDVTSKGFKKTMEDPMARFTIGLKLAQSGINDFKKAFEAFKEFNNIIIGTARNLGLSGDQIRSFSATAVASQTQFNDKFNQNVYSTAQLTKSLQEVNEQLGLSVNIGQENNNEFTKMTQTMGLSADEATKIYKLGTLNNMSLKDTNKAISAGIVAAQKSTGVQINAKQVFQEIGKLSAGITAKFQQNPEAIAKAVTQAKALGTSLETIDKIGESLLNFESSIENQLKAQLLTGKQLNLEQARYAALTGDQATLMSEISSQVGSLSDFTRMNVIAQRSLAEAFGMSKDELADMLQKQETFNKLGDVSGKSAAEQLKLAKERGLTESDSLVVNLQQQAAAEKLDATFSNIKMALGDILSGPLGGVVNMMAALSKHTGLVYALLTAMAGISLGKLILGIISMATSLVTAGVSAATITSALTFGLGAIAIGAAIAGIIGAATSANDSFQSKVNKGAAFAVGGIVTSEINNATIGEAGPEAIIPLNSPKASEMLGINKPNLPSFNTSAITDAISALSNTVNGLINRPQATPQFALHIDGKQLGTVVGSQMETGTAQNIYTGYQMA
jgi:hypothetical protein